MFTSLDLLIVVVLALGAAGLLSLMLMFLVKNQRVRQVCLYVVAALGLYMGYVGFRIHYPGFMPRMLVAVVLGLTALGAVVLERLGKTHEKKLHAARLLAAVAMVAGMVNAFS